MSSTEHEFWNRSSKSVRKFIRSSQNEFECFTNILLSSATDKRQGKLVYSLSLSVATFLSFDFFFALISLTYQTVFLWRVRFMVTERYFRKRNARYINDNFACDSHSRLTAKTRMKVNMSNIVNR